MAVEAPVLDRDQSLDEKRRRVLEAKPVQHGPGSAPRTPRSAPARAEDRRSRGRRTARPAQTSPSEIRVRIRPPPNCPVRIPERTQVDLRRCGLDAVLAGARRLFGFPVPEPSQPAVQLVRIDPRPRRKVGRCGVEDNGLPRSALGDLDRQARAADREEDQENGRRRSRRGRRGSRRRGLFAGPAAEGGATSGCGGFSSNSISNAMRFITPLSEKASDLGGRPPIVEFELGQCACFRRCIPTWIRSGSRGHLRYPPIERGIAKCRGLARGKHKARLREARSVSRPEVAAWSCPARPSTDAGRGPIRRPARCEAVKSCAGRRHVVSRSAWRDGSGRSTPSWDRPIREARRVRPRRFLPESARLGASMRRS